MVEFHYLNSYQLQYTPGQSFKPPTLMKGITNAVVNMAIAPKSNSVYFSTEMCGLSLGWKIFKFVTFLGPGLNDSFFEAQNI